MLEPELLKEARSKAEETLDAERRLERARADYHHAIRRLHLNGGSMREISDALGMSHQRVGQIVKAASRSWLSRWTEREPRRLCCSFCSRTDSRVEALVAGPDVHICDGCIDAAQDVAESGSPARRPTVLVLVEDRHLRCSFCSKRARASRRIVGTSSARICTECLELAHGFASR